MTKSVRIYALGPSYEEDRAEIDFTIPANGADNHDWRRSRDVLDGKLPPEAAPPRSFVVEESDALDFHFYANPGTPGMLSAAALELLRPFCGDRFAFAPVKINDVFFYMPICVQKTDCLDREHSVLIPFPSDPDNVMSIKKYVFLRNRLQDPMIFCIPELRMKMFITEGGKQAIDDSGLRGIDTEYLGDAV